MTKRILPILTLLVFIGQFAAAQNNSLLFDGTNDYIQTTSPGITGSAERTVEAWVKTSWSGTQRVILNWGVQATSSRYTFSMNGGNIRIEVQGNGVSGSFIGDGTWHHVAATFDNSLPSDKHKLFVDGVMVAGSNLTVATNTQPGDIIIGRRVDGINYWQGNIDDVRAWNVARSAGEIAANMNTELTGTEANLIFYSKFDDDMASCDVVDCSTGQNHGARMGGGPQFTSDVPAGITDADCAICMTNCAIGTCSISAISVSNISACDDNGTDSDPSDDTFTADVTVDFMGEPASGTLDLSGDGTASIAVGSLSGCTHTFTGVAMSADGGAIDLTATFSANGACTLNNSNAGTAPTSCSNAPPPPPMVCAIMDISTSNISACDDNGTQLVVSDDTFTADVTVTFENAPATGTLNLTGDATASVGVGSIGATSHTFTGLTMSANGTPIGLTAAFSDDAACTFSDSNTGQAPNQCSIVIPPGSIPTMSEWGLILFALIIFTFSVVLGTQHQQKVAVAGSSMNAGSKMTLPFNKVEFLKVLPMVYLGFVVVFAIAISLFGYELTSADVPGSLLSGLVIAYLVQFVMNSSKQNK